MRCVLVRAKRELPTARLIERSDLTPDLVIIRLEPEIPYTFAPGQYCTIGVEGIERPYSIVSSPHEPYLELFVELVPHGALTPRLWRLRLGDPVSLRPRPKGVFILQERYPSHLMVATVTGIAPFVSMLRFALHHGDQRFRFRVLQGASYQDEFAYRAELQAAAADQPHLLTYVPSVSRPGDERNRGWTGAAGRVNLIVEEHVERLGLVPESTLVYACGHPGMIADVAGRLSPRGFTVKEERYWQE
jgi:ferredoxin--NADP+ reductase